MTLGVGILSIAVTLIGFKIFFSLRQTTSPHAQLEAWGGETKRGIPLLLVASYLRLCILGARWQLKLESLLQALPKLRLFGSLGVRASRHRLTPVDL